MLKRIDEFLLSKAQLFCDKALRVVGITKFTLQKWSMILGTCLIVLFTLLSQIHTYIYGSIFLVIVASVEVFLAEVNEKRFLNDNRLPFEPLYNSHFRRFSVFWFGLSFLVMFIEAVENEILILCSAVFFICWIYFAACIPLQPGKSKARELCDNLLTTINNWLKPASVPTS